MFEEFYGMYGPKEQEVVALIKRCIGGGYHNKGDFWGMTVVTLGMVLWRRWPKNWRSCWRAAASYARQMQDRLAPDLWQKKQEVMNMSIELSRDELLVLYDLLHRLEDVEEIFEDPSEQEVLWHIQTQLEKELVEPFQADYQAIIEEARRAVTEQY